MVQEIYLPMLHCLMIMLLLDRVLPSTIARSSGAEDGNSAVPRNYFEARSGFLPLLNLLPDISANRVPIGTALFEKPTGFMYGAFIANMLWTFNVFNHKPVFRGDVWTLEFRSEERRVGKDCEFGR